MKIACFGDVVGKAGLEAIVKYVKANKAKHKFDFVIVNGENSANGFGITKAICSELFGAGVDVITLGNHTFDQKNELGLVESEKNLIRPINYPKNTPGRGHVIVANQNTGKKLLVINAIGRSFMELNDNPFFVIEEFLKQHKLGANIDAIIIDFHAQVTAEKAALAKYFDGMVSGIFGSHTHIPTADARIFPNGTGFISDCGMCGDYNSIIGYDYAASLLRFTKKTETFARITPASGDSTVCGVVMEIDDTGLCFSISSIRKGGCLVEQVDCATTK